MNDNRALYTEETIIGAVKGLLTGRVNELLSVAQFHIPLIEFSDCRDGSVVVPDICLFSCERSEKERIVLLDAYALTITFTLPETPDSELYCYAYAAAVSKAVAEDPTLGGVADRAAITGKKYTPPEHSHCGQQWQVVITLRITTEGMKYAG